MTQPFPIPELHVDAMVAVHTAEIGHLKETTGRIEGKLDKLLWCIIGALGTSAGTLLVLILKK